MEYSKTFKMNRIKTLESVRTLGGEEESEMDAINVESI